MRLQSINQVAVGNKVLGGPTPLVCLPLVGSDAVGLIAQAEAIEPLAPDLFEWRIDAYDRVDEPADAISTLQTLKNRLAGIPCIFTCRIDAEGGFKKISQETRLKTIVAVVESGLAELVDIELCNEQPFIARVKDAAVAHSSQLILSYHNFVETPDESFILGKLEEAAARGADIAKVAVMPKSYGDVLALLGATFKARTGRVRLPLVTMAMGAEGAVTRVAGGLFGSDITFAIGKESSAPGQIPIGDLRQAMAVLYR